MSRFYKFVTIILIHVSAAREENNWEEPCIDIDIEAVTLQNDRCVENTFRIGSVPVLINQICKGFSTFQNGKIPYGIKFETENNFFDVQQTLATNILWGIEPEPINVSLRYIFNFFRERYLFLLYINNTLISLYNESTVLYCNVNTTLTERIGDYVKGRGVGILKVKASELQNKWKDICTSLEIPMTHGIDTTFTECASPTYPAILTSEESLIKLTQVDTSTPLVRTRLSNYTYSPDTLSNSVCNNVCACESMSTIVVVGIISATVILVTVLLIVKKRLGSSENRYHKKLSKYWL